MSIENRRALIFRRGLLVCHYFSRVVFVDFEPVFRQINAHFSHLLCDFAIVPTMEDSSAIGPEGYYITEDLEGRKRLVYYGVVSLAVTLDRCCQATKT
jgi:hypothetical protein